MSQLSPGTMIVSVFAVLFGLVGAYSVRRYLEPPTEIKKELPQAAAPQTLTVPLASIDLVKGRKLVLGDIQIMSITREQLAKRKDVPKEYMANARQLIGRHVKTDMKKGSFFELASLYPQGTGPTISDRLKKGLRAVSIKCDATGLVNGLVGAGNFVDVIFRTTASDVANENEIPETTLTLLENVEILAVGRDVQKGSTQVSTMEHVTLAVTPKQAATLKVVEGRGTFSLLLRGSTDSVKGDNSAPKTLEQLLNLPPKKTLAEREPFTTEIYRGSQRSRKTYSQDQVLNESVAPQTGRASPKVYRKETPVVVPQRKAS